MISYLLLPQPYLKTETSITTEPSSSFFLAPPHQITRVSIPFSRSKKGKKKTTTRVSVSNIIWVVLSLGFGYLV
ncbi:hypothetical protein C5167_020455 [Papaver somniferum]|uniref:Uncharacterized protein n=1 Tax=Papaver somniferum TaxID=3469 RepID=A0A4Y7IT28_PAPSO|nr:hypothetical protein C5167_020455 [Papaver somniferum]